MRTRNQPLPPAAWSSWVERDRRYAMLLHRAARWPGLVRTLIASSRLGDGPAWCVMIAILPWLDGARGSECALRMLVMGAANLLVYKLLKCQVARSRPFVDCPEIRPCTPSLDEYSFPSGHTWHAVAFGTVLIAYYPACAWLICPFLLLLGLSRVILGLHYPSDVAAAAVLGLLSAAIALQLG